MNRRIRFDFDLRDHGAPVRRGSLFSMAVAPDPRTRREKIYLAYNPFIIVQMDAASGRCVQFDADSECSGPWGMANAPDGRIVVSSCHGQVAVIDPLKKSVRVAARAPKWLWCVTRAADGMYYLGGHEDAGLYRFDLATNRLEALGSVDRTRVILRMVEADSDGFVYGSIGCTAAQVIAYEIATGRVRTILPKREELPNLHKIGKGADGRIYASCMSGNIYRLEHGAAQPVAKNNWPGFAKLKLSDGATVQYLDPDQVEITRGRATRTFRVRYDPPPIGIFHLAVGPRKAVYGSSILPLYLFRYDPRRDKLRCFGRGAPDNGEAYSFGHVDGKLYYATYPSGHLLVYEPAWRWAPGKDWSGNPRNLGPLGAGHCRPRAMVVDALKRVWVGSYAEYGRYHGGLACYDPVRGKLQNNCPVIPNQSISSLTVEPTGRFVFGGTDIIPGSAVQPVTKEALLFAWDVTKRKVAWRCVPVPGEERIAALLYLGGKLYGATWGAMTFFVFDVATQKVERVVKSRMSGAREESMARASDGNIYGITWRSLFRLRPNGDIDELWRCIGEPARKYGGSLFHRGAAIIDGRMYFSCGANVMSVRLPLENA